VAASELAAARAARRQVAEETAHKSAADASLARCVVLAAHALTLQLQAQTTTTAAAAAAAQVLAGAGGASGVGGSGGVQGLSRAVVAPQASQTQKRRQRNMAFSGSRKRAIIFRK
jgi:hypothetical protein